MMSSDEINQNIDTISNDCQIEALKGHSKKNCQHQELINTIQHEKCEKTECLKTINDFVSYDEGKRKENNESNEHYLHLKNKNVGMEQNEQYKKMARINKKSQKLSLQKRNLGTGEKHVNDLWYII